jgi:hypothetical protein
MSNDTTYNGWTNYATWRVNLEMMDGYELSDEQAEMTAYELGQIFKDECTDLLEMECNNARSLVLDYALSFISEVNWAEIAENHLSEYKNN